MDASAGRQADSKPIVAIAATEVGFRFAREHGVVARLVRRSPSASSRIPRPQGSSSQRLSQIPSLDREPATLQLGGSDAG